MVAEWGWVYFLNLYLCLLCVYLTWTQLKVFLLFRSWESSVVGVWWVLGQNGDSLPVFLYYHDEWLVILLRSDKANPATIIFLIPSQLLASFVQINFRHSDNPNGAVQIVNNHEFGILGCKQIWPWPHIKPQYFQLSIL